MRILSASRAPEELADRLELSLIGGRDTSMSNASAIEFLNEIAGASENDTALALNHMKWRATSLDDAYPFVVADVGVKLVLTEAHQPYVAMCLLSAMNAPFRASAKGIQRAAEVFEDLVVPATASLLGPGSQSMRFAWPSTEGRPKEFPRAVAWLAAKMGIQVGTAYRPPRMQDGGVDVVSWRPFPDGRSGFPILLTQVTLERSAVGKSTDIDLRVWSGYLRFDLDPATALALPYVVRSREEWNEMSARTIVLDRVRLASLLFPSGLTGRAATWLGDQIAAIKATEWPS